MSKRNAWLTTSRRGIAQMLALWTGGRQRSKLLISLEGLVLMAGALGPFLIAYINKAEENARLSLEVPRSIYELLVLALLVLFWCGWCEGGYRLGRQLDNVATVPWRRRLTLELWTGVLSSLLLSILTSLSPLLPLVGVFLLFAGLESLKVSGSGEELWTAARSGFSESFRTVSLAPVQILSLMVVPGLLLYLNSLLLRVVTIEWRNRLVSASSGLNLSLAGLFGLAIGLAVLGTGLFFMARTDLALQYLRIQGTRSWTTPPELDAVLTDVRCWSRLSMAAAFILASLFGGVQLISSDLFSRSFFYQVLEACVGSVNRLIQSFLDLLTKFAFLFVVLALIASLCIILVSLAKGNGDGLLGRSIRMLVDRVRGFSTYLSDQIDIPGQAIQITTVLSALGLIVTQTYSKVVETQNQRFEQERRDEQQAKRQQQQEQSYAETADQLILKYQKNLEALGGKDQGTNGWLDLDRRSQVASSTQDLLRQLIKSNGEPDRVRRGRVLNYLYASRWLLADQSGSYNSNKCKDDPLARVSKSEPRTLSTLPPVALDKKLIDAGNTTCLPRLVPLQMNFSSADLSNALLNRASLPFINLSYADLRGAQLRDADLRFANLSNANLRGADLSSAKLDYADLANAELRRAKMVKASLKGAILFYATMDQDLTEDGEDALKGNMSWDLAKDAADGKTKDAQLAEVKPKAIWCPLDPRMDRESGSTSSDLDNKKDASAIAQAGAKCGNRSYSGYKRKRDFITNRNWAGGNFQNTTIENFRLNSIDFTNANLKGAVFRYVRLQDVRFIGANLEGARFENSVLNRVDFTGATTNRMTFVASTTERLTSRGSETTLPTEVDLSTASIQSSPFRLAQRLLLPILLAPYPFRPSRVLIWLVPYSPELLFATTDRQSIP